MRVTMLLLALLLQDEPKHFDPAVHEATRTFTYADFLVVDGDPLRDPRELRKLTTVYRGGVAHDPQAILAQAPQSDLGHQH